MVYWEQIEKLTYKILYEEYNDYDLSLLGEAYICFNNIKDSYDETQSSFTTYYAKCLRTHLKTYNQYNSDLIHVPVLKKSDNKQIFNSIHAKIDNDSELTLGDTISSTIETDAELSYNSLIEYLNKSLDINDSESICLDCLLTEKEYPRELRTHMCNLKIKIRTKLISLQY